MKQDHAFLLYKNKGMCRRMRGNILVELIFVSDRQTLWLQDEMDTFYDVYKNAVAGLCRQASAAGVPLSFSAVVGRLVYDGVMDPKDFSSVVLPRVHSQYLREQGFANFDDYMASRKRTGGVDEVGIIFVMERHFRAFAQTGNSLEYCVMTEGNDAHAIAHELLHLFGAVDLYFPYHVYGLTMEYFPKTIMCTYEGTEVDPLTQYLVGWTEQMSPKASEFMQKLQDYTVPRYYQALTLEFYRNQEEYLLQNATPYASVDAIRKRSLEDDPWAGFLLGLCYRDGIGMEKDAANAEDWFRRSGRMGLTIAAFAQAQMILCRGLKNQKDSQSLRLIMDYSGYDHLRLSSLRLACYLTGTAYPQNQKFAIDCAVSYYQNDSAILAGAKRSLQFYRIAEKLSTAIPALHKVVELLRFRYEKALDGGDPDLQFMIAQLLEKGVHVQRDLSGAFTLYKLAAENANYRACQELARCYQDGIGTARDADAARQWRVLASIYRDEEKWDAFCRLM